MAEEAKQVESPETKSKFIRTFAKDVAELGQTIPKEFTPAPEAKKKIKSVEKKASPAKTKKPIAEALPTAVRPSQQDPSFVPVPTVSPAAKDAEERTFFPKKKETSIQEEVRKTRQETTPAPMPFSVPIPAPMPPVQKPRPQPPQTPKKEELSPIHTYKTDFAENIDTQKASTFSVLAEQLDAGSEPKKETRIVEKKKFPIVPVVLGILLVIAGSGGIWFAYTTINHPEVGIPAYSVPTLVFADDRKELSGPDFSNALVESLSDPLDEGKIRVVYSATASTTASGILHIPNEGTVLISKLHLNAPDLLLRNIEGISTTGTIRSNGETSAFFVLRTSSYERTFSAMLTWESHMATDLAWLFPQATVVASSASVASTTATSTKATSTIPTTPPITAPTFKDKVVGNYNLRVLTDATGKVILCYGYKDKQTLIIARNPDVFVVLAGRLVATK